MRRRARIDLGEQVSAKEQSNLERKKERWAARNKHRPPSENPFLDAIKPDHANYGDPSESVEEFRARLENLEFGNFPGYFNYRKNATPHEATGEAAQQQNRDCDNDEGNVTQSRKQKESFEAGLSDERLKSMQTVWFSNKDVLDIGCNRGHITYAIARMFSPNLILGIDIDLKMINMANRDLHLHLEDCLLKEGELMRRQRAASLKVDNPVIETYQEDLDHYPLSCYVAQGPLVLPAAYDKSNEHQSKFPNNMLFVEHNYTLARDDLVDKQKPYFDTIVCLSVTKWVHLNYRDDGLKRFFKRIYNHLKADGLLILEAQPFDNYGRRKKLSDRLRANYHSIRFKPDQFDSYLLSVEVGFRKIIYSTTTDHKCSGFKRPLKVFLK